MKTELTIKGVDELMETLLKGGGKVANDATKIVMNNAEKGQSIAKRNAAVDTGFMRDNIETYYSDDTAYIHSRAFYSGFVEYGTRFMSAQPFMRPMLNQIKPVLLKDLQDLARGAFK